MSKNIVLLLAGALCACSGGSGEAPEISNLIYSPETVTAGETVTIQGSIDFSDADGDVDAIGIEVLSPAGAMSELPRNEIQGADGMNFGTVGIQIFLAASASGTYAFELYVVDREGNESNRLSGSLTAEAN